MSRIIQSTIDKIAEDCIKSFKTLSKTGKPLENEWTVLTCLIQNDTLSGNYKIVALGTGSKCIGASKMSSSGHILNDSHAEVMARRGFLLYLYKNIELCLENKDSIFELEHAQCKLKPNIDFVFFSSQLPCGDASIIRKNEIDEQVGKIVSSTKRLAQNHICELEEKRPRLDIFRTGAKCLEKAVQDPKLPGVEYHLLGQVRTKPGRGDRTLSVSCSDKIARWVHLGVQGSLIAMLIDEPIYIKHFIFGAGMPYSEETLKRALFSRDLNTSESIRLGVHPHLYQCTITFPYIKGAQRTRPAPSSIVWVNINNGISDVAVQGKKLGATRKKENCPSNYLSISKYNLFKSFLDILYKNNEWCEKICGSDILENIPYNEMKKKSKKYMTKWKEVKESFFKNWPIKPDIFNFKKS